MTDDEDDVGMAPPGVYAEGESDRPTCTGTTITGKRCEIVVIRGFDVCHRHIDQSDDVDLYDDRADDDDEGDDTRELLERHPINEVFED